MFPREKRYHEPREEAVEKFIDSSSTFQSDRGYIRDEDKFYSDIVELSGEGWDFWRVASYNEAIDIIRYLKRRGYKVKVINKGNRSLIFYKAR